MDQESQVKFDEIVAKDAAALTEADIAVLKARASYLTAEQRERFAYVLGGQEESSAGSDSADDDSDEDSEEESDSGSEAGSKSAAE